MHAEIMCLYITDVGMTCAHLLCNMFVFIFSASQSMDDEGKQDVPSNTHLQVSYAACEYSESTDSDIEENKMYSAVSSDCEMSADIPTHRMDDYNVSQVTTPAHERQEDVQEDVQAGDGYSRQGDSGHMVKCLLQELSEQSHVLPVNTIHQETNWTLDADETIQVKQEKKEYPDGYDRSSKVTRHWVVCPGGVLKEVKAEHTSDVSDISAKY